MKIALVVPYFGAYPVWMPHWARNTQRMQKLGYDFLFDDNEDEFRKRVQDKLAIDCPPMAGTGNIWDFRPAFGVLYAEELRDFDFWGHTDFDCVYGRVERFVTPALLNKVDIFSNHGTYICGCWTLYRNTPAVNTLFECVPGWTGFMEVNRATGWAEQEFTYVVDCFHEAGEIVRRYEMWQTDNLDSFDELTLERDGRLLENGQERMMAHFRRTKTYPEGCIR